MAADNAPARRRYIVYSDENGQLNRGYAHELLSDLEATLHAVGGMVTIAAQRTTVDHVGDEPVAITTKLVLEWRAHSPLPLLDATGAAPSPEPDFEPADLADEPDDLEDDPDMELSPEELEPVAAG